MTKKVDKYELLAEVVRALRDINTEIEVESQFNFNGKTPKLPEKYDIKKNKKYANAISFVGKGINIRHEFTDNGAGYKYILHTPNGEATFYPNDRDFLHIWGQALIWYEFSKEYGKLNAFAHVSEYLPIYLKNEKLRALAKDPGNWNESEKSKFERAVDKLKSLGVKPGKEIMAKYAAMQKQND